MKKIFCFTTLLFAVISLFGQESGYRPLSAIPVIEISTNSSLHFRSPEPIHYVDLPLKFITGELPIKNLLSVKINVDSLKKNMLSADLGVVTIVGETFMAQYHLLLSPPGLATQSAVDIEILPCMMVPLDPAPGEISTSKVKSHAMDVLLKRVKHPLTKTSMLGISAELNQVYSLGELIFLDISFKNETLMQYDIDQVRFSIEDKKIHRATNQQSIEIQPVFSLYAPGSFKKNLRNIYVIKKVSFSSEKLLRVSLNEKQPSSRTLSLNIAYADLLHADSF